MEANQILDEWQRFFNQGDLKNLVRLYSDEAVLWATFSDTLRDSPGLIREYFETLLEKDGLRVEWGTMRTRSCDGFHLYSGTYAFSYVDGKPVTVPARFTFVIGRDKDAGFRILTHHSSLMPSNLEA